MTHTNRSETFGHYFRRPQTQKERAELRFLIDENLLDGYELSHKNRMRKRFRALPVFWDDIQIAALQEKDYTEE